MNNYFGEKKPAKASDSPRRKKSLKSSQESIATTLNLLVAILEDDPHHNVKCALESLSAIEGEGEFPPRCVFEARICLHQTSDFGFLP